MSAPDIPDLVRRRRQVLAVLRQELTRRLETLRQLTEGAIVGLDKLAGLDGSGVAVDGQQLAPRSDPVPVRVVLRRTPGGTWMVVGLDERGRECLILASTSE